MFRIVIAIATLLMTTFATQATLACDTCKSKFKEGTYLGAAKVMGNGTAYSWVTLNAKGKPSAIGLTFTETALTGLPPTQAPGAMPPEYTLELPKEAEKTAFNHIGLNWNPQGHPPTNIYGVPHFDFHFYMIPMKDRSKITAKGDDLAKCRKPVPAGGMPAGYIMADGSQEPEMGMHWVDPTSPELQGKPFTTTFIYGSYDGNVIFYEPMLALAFLETKPQFTQEIKVPSRYPKSDYYPTRYRVAYDATRHEYTVALEGLTWREASETPQKVLSRITDPFAKGPSVAR